MPLRQPLLAMVFVIAAVGGACAHPTERAEPADGAGTPRSAVPTSPTSPTGAASPEATPPTPPMPTAPGIRIGFAQPAWYQDEYDLPAVDTALHQIRETGAGWVVLTPTWYQKDIRKDVPRFDREKTVTDAGVRRAISAAKAEGLRVVLKPHVDRDDDGDRAEIRPNDPRRWFDAYKSLVGHYAEIATTSGVDEFVVGTELTGTSGQEEPWREIIGLARTTFAGPLTYAANYDEFQGIRFWDALDAVGIDAYFPLATRPTTDPDALASAWAPIVGKLEELATATGKPILFTEAGYPSQVGAAVAPYDWEQSKVRSDGEQAAGYEALFAAFVGRPWFLGVYWWMWDDLPGRTEDNQAVDYTPHGKPAEAIIRRFASAAAATGPG